MDIWRDISGVTDTAFTMLYAGFISPGYFFFLCYFSVCYILFCREHFGGAYGTFKQAVCAFWRVCRGSCMPSKWGRALFPTDLRPTNIFHFIPLLCAKQPWYSNINFWTRDRNKTTKMYWHVQMALSPNNYSYSPNSVTAFLYICVPVYAAFCCFIHLIPDSVSFWVAWRWQTFKTCLHFSFLRRHLCVCFRLPSHLAWL